ncbi:16S rRNA (cytosine(1402)-N(4))-methyltransferase RsmH [Candidatus Latescibacterota bacterium]
MTDESYHIPVMLDEVIDYLDIVTGGIYIDCTLGGCGHSLAILEHGGTIIGLDRDRDAIVHAENILSGYRGRFSVHHERFSTLAKVAAEHAGNIDGVLMDLGVSSKMIDDPSKGFSYRFEGPLLMSMGRGDTTAQDVVNTMPVHELSVLFLQYGEEKNARKIARAIVDSRSSHPITSTTELADIIENTVRSGKPQKTKSRIFQALRIYVNDELDELRLGLDGALSVLKPGGRLCVISYHSLEDRLVKNFMREHADPCICPRDLPQCRCGRAPDVNLIKRKALKPSPGETARNPRARSARFRVAEKVSTV